MVQYIACVGGPWISITMAANAKACIAIPPDGTYWPPIVYGRLFAAREALHGPPPRGVFVDHVEGGLWTSYNNRVPTTQETQDVLQARSRMSWAALTNDTTHLGGTWPLMLASVREIEEQGIADYLDEVDRVQARSVARRLKVLKKLKSSDIDVSSFIYAVDTEGAIQWKRLCKPNPAFGKQCSSIAQSKAKAKDKAKAMAMAMD